VGHFFKQGRSNPKSRINNAYSAIMTTLINPGIIHVVSQDTWNWLRLNTWRANSAENW